MKPKISVIIPVHNERQSLLRLYTELKKTLEIIKDAYEIIFIDDGSSDNSFFVLEKLAKNDNRIKAIKLTKNYGQGAALSSGFSYCTGKYIITMDADLQFRPIDIKKFIEKLNDGYHVVCGYRKNKHKIDSIGKKFPSSIFNFLMSKITGVKIHDWGGGMRGLKKEVANNIPMRGEMHRYLPLMALKSGYRVTEVEIRIRKRCYGKSNYGVGRLWCGFTDLLTITFGLFGGPASNPIKKNKYIEEKTINL